MRKITLLLASALIILITACSSDEKITPHDVFDTYIDYWQKEDFQNVYNMLSEDAASEHTVEEVVDRYQKIYEDLDITDLQITYNALSEEALEQAFEDGEATLSFTAEMESLAGPIAFDYEATLTQHGEEEEYNWFVEWEPGFIFPDLNDGGSIRIETTTPVRGEILDRNDMPLALNDLVYEIGIVPEKLDESKKERIGQLLQMSVDAIDTNLNAGWVEPDLFVPLKTVPKTKEDVLNELWEIDGVAGQEVTGRVYPSGEVAAHLVGYIGQITAEELEDHDEDTYGPNDMIGKRGLEQIFEEQLKGEKGVEFTISKENDEDILLAEVPTKNGEDIKLTIDINIQEKVFDTYEGEAGTATIIDPKSGETLALVSSPSFDPNEFLYGISQSRWDELSDDPQAPLLNRFAATYAPGSVIKPITAAIGLENGSIIPDDGVDIKGLTWGNGKGWGDFKVKRVSESNKPVDLADALMRSDNIYFAMKAVDMGADKFIEGLENFGFGEKSPFQYPITNSSISSSGQLSGEVEVANTSYGQAEIEVSTLHLATTYSAFLNEGNMIKPTLLLDEDTGEIWHEKLLSSENALLMQDILRSVVTKGTAKVANVDDVEISGKTGTAELKQSHDSKGHENGWFVGYPTKKQDVIVALMVEHAEDIGTSTLAAEKVTKIIQSLQ